MSVDTISKYALRPASAFVIGAAGTKVFCPAVANMCLDIKGVMVPVWVFGGLSSAIGVALGQVVNDYVAPHITTLTALNAPMHSALNVGIGTGGTAMAYHMAAGEGWTNSVGITSVVAISAVSEIGSGYLTEMWWKPMLQSYMQ